MTTRAKKNDSRKLVYLWRKSVSQSWIDKHENALRDKVGDRLALIERSDQKRIQLEATFESGADSTGIAKEFGGEIRRLPRDWLRRFTQTESKPLRIGKRLIVVRSSKERAAGSFPDRLVIPASAAFGTGEHTTTAMSLRLLERTISLWGAQAAGPQTPAVRWSNSCSAGRRTSQASRQRFPDVVIDVGTGSGILALAASKLGAKRAIGIDNDPTAISVAKQNARLNKIDNVAFRIADVRRWKFPNGSHLRASGYGGQVDIVTANLFSELLIEILPKLKCARRLILSGILREQERQIVRALRRNKIDILEVRRRGKWIAIAAALD